MIKLLKYLKFYKKEAILAPLFKLLEATFELFVPLVIAAIIDEGIKTDDSSFVIKMCGVLVILAIVGLISAITAQFFSAKAACGFAAKIRDSLYSHISELSYAELDKIGTSTLITRLTSDINQVQTGLNLTLRLLLRSPFIVFGAMIMAFTVDVQAALIFVVTIPILAAIVFAVMLVSIPLFKKVQTYLDRVVLQVRENLSGTRVIRAFCKEDAEINDFDEEVNTLLSSQLFVGKISALLNPLTYVIINIAIIALVYRGAIRVSCGILTQGAVVALYNYMSQILVELVKLANLIINITKSIASGNRIQNILEINPSIKEKTDALQQIADTTIEFKDVSFCYQSANEPSIKDITFTVAPGETIGVIGGTGSGKSTLINLIPRFYDATSGNILIDGKNIQDYSLSALRKKIAVVPQKSILFSGTLRENMCFEKEDATDAEIIEAIALAQGADILDKKPEGLDTIIEQGGQNLSGGQRQRLTIARALIKKSEILILDDSASALDFLTESKLRNALASLSHKPTVFIVSQRASSVMNADKIVVLDDGKMVGYARHEELLKTCEIYREIYETQFEKEDKENA